MKFFLLLFAFISIAYCSTAQTFSNNTGGPIPDNNTLVCYPVSVSGIAPQIDSSAFGVLSVTVNLHHTYDSDIKIMLQSPDGTIVHLSNNNGGGGDDYTNTSFTEDAGITAIVTGVAPFNGTYNPDQSINHFNNGQDPNGTWSLCIIDEVPADSGHLFGYSITFGPNPPATPIVAVCNTSNATSCNCPDGIQNCDLLPNMVNSTQYISNNYTEYNGYVTVGVATPNIGYGPMEMRGTGSCFCDTIPVLDCMAPCPNGDYPKELVNQRIYHKDSSSMTFYDVPAGTMSYHPSHGHIHIDHWTLNTLRIPGPNSNPTTWPIIGTATKVSFCLINLGDCGTPGNGNCQDSLGAIIGLQDVGNPGLGSVTGCGTEQGIYAGYLDIYSQGYQGQDIQFGNICNGWYYVCSITDPYNIVHEMSETDNYSYFPIFLSLQQPNCCHAGFTADTTVGYPMLQVQFMDTTKPISDHWLWNFGDGTTDTVQFPIHIYTAPGDYTVTLKTQSKTTNCQDSTGSFHYIHINEWPAGISNVNASDIDLKTYPNPFESKTTVYYTLPCITHVKIEITDLLGKQIANLQDKYMPAGKHQMDISSKQFNLSQGMYMLHVNTGDKNYFLKLIVQ